jgi:membrane fusion protein (multidrug efflux system)
VQASRAAVNAAQVEVNKLKPLVEKNIISNVQLQTAIANLAKAQAQLSQAIASQQQASASYKSAKANIIIPSSEHLFLVLLEITT